MEQRKYTQWLKEHVKFTLMAALLLFGAMARAQIQYSISEEQKDGAAVGNIAKDLGIDPRSLKERGFRIVSTSGESMFSVNQNDGVLYVNDYSSKYLQDTNYDGTLCHSIQYRSGDKRYMLVGPRMSIGSTIVPGSNGNTLVIPDRRRRDSGECSKSTDYSSKYLQDTNYDGTLCHSIQYRSGDKRYMLVGPRMSIGSTIAPGSNRNTLVIPDRRRRDSGEEERFRRARAQIQYSISEEQKEGAAVGNIAKDLGIDHRLLKERGFRIVSTSGESMFSVNQNDGVLYVNDYSTKYLQDTNYDGTLCHSIQYRSGDKRYMLVGPRMSIGSTIAPGSNRNTLVIPDRRRRDSGEVSK
ncbi:hypothetical protein QQF64_006819 [Cirrhinus molitorella]|uniref:Cadherin N-terminal domain-containing protein n=1 Tax=Cirrhinus molitorella TaxID=172907 RepID=A0ABR3MC61_9TELE